MTCLFSCKACPTLLPSPWAVSHQLPLSLVFPRQESGVGCHFLLQGIFPTQGWNPRCPCLLCGRWILYQWATWEALEVTMWKFLSCLILFNSLGYIVHRILQARILEWVAIPFSRGSSQPRNWTGVSWLAGGFFTNWAIREAQKWHYFLLNKREWNNIRNWCMR